MAFLVGAAQGITYHANTWHHPLTILDRPARFAVVMWRDGTRTDEEFRKALYELGDLTSLVA